MDADSAFDQLAEVIQAIRESAKLQAWFGALLNLSIPERTDSIQRMAQEMTIAGEPEPLVTALWLLANATICEAVKSALLEDGLAD
jgi:hypothetical protein